MFKRVYQIVPKNDGCLNWMKDFIDAPDYMWMGNNLCVEHGYIEDIVIGLIENGYERGIDFFVV